MGGVLCGDNSLTSLVLDGCTRLWELRFANNGLSGELDLSPFSLTRIASEGNRLETIYVPQDFDPDATYFMGGVGTLPCYTKDAEYDGIREHARIRAFLPAYQQNERRILSRITS